MMRTGCGLLAAAALLALPATARSSTPIWAVPADTLSPSSIAAGPHGRMWVSSGVMSTSSSRPQYAIARMDLAGHTKLFRTHAETDGIAVAASGTVFGTEHAAGRVAIVSPSGQVREIAVPGGDDSRPYRIAAGRDGNGWFVQDGTSQVGRITPSGQITEFDLPPVPDFYSSEDTTDAEPRAITAGTDGRLWVPIENGIATVRTDGRIEEHTWAFPFPAEASDVAAAPDGTVWTSEVNESQVEHVDAAGHPTALPGVQAASLLVARDGTLSEFDPGSPTRTRLSAGGHVTTQRLRIADGSGKPVRARVNGLQPVAAGPHGTTWIVADLAHPDGGETDAIAVLDDSGRCFVPDLYADGLADAKAELRSHGCRLGRVRRHNPRHFERSLLAVVRQSVRAGRVRRGNTKVSVTLSP